MDTFMAIAEPTRRSIVELLATNGRMSATHISRQFRASPPAISQHLKVLRESRVLTMQKEGQHRIYQVNPAAMHELERWAKTMADRYEERHSALDALLESEKAKLIN